MNNKFLKITIGSLVALMFAGCAAQKNITLDELKANKSPLVMEDNKYELSDKQKQLRMSKKFESMLFFDKYTYSDDDTLKMCIQNCNEYSLDKNGYKHLDEAQKDGWELYTKMERVEVEVSSDCSCSGRKVLLKRK